MDNKFPGKDISDEDLKSKFPLTSSLNKKKIIKITDDILFAEDTCPIIAGPNTVENKDMMFRCAETLEKKKIKLMRGGIYKPLTFPYRSKKFFELGDEGLKILEAVKKNFDVLIVSEIMESEKIPLMIDCVDIFQIGARNMQNYPLITKVAKQKKPLIIKRHFGSSIRDLMGSAEYALIEKNENVILCERGISVPHTHRSSSRFLLDLQAIPAIKDNSCLPIISDPSHASFWHKWVPSLSLASLAVGANGLMLETHPDPRNAAVDPLQSISFDEFSDLIDKLRELGKVLNKKII
jgi:3-deoxy-7-phosphoheptulonate synthase|tara:strand:+ start:2993 stop:3874 length:882 start_codon:yes stop_codon:yes gene_type:complete